MCHTVKAPDGGPVLPAPLAPLFRLAWQHSRRRIYEWLRRAGYEDLGLADLAVFQYPTPVTAVAPGNEVVVSMTTTDPSGF
jgi:hypothetical protein